MRRDAIGGHRRDARRARPRGLYGLRNLRNSLELSRQAENGALVSCNFAESPAAGVRAAAQSRLRPQLQLPVAGRVLMDAEAWGGLESGLYLRARARPFLKLVRACAVRHVLQLAGTMHVQASCRLK